MKVSDLLELDDKWAIRETLRKIFKERSGLNGHISVYTHHPDNHFAIKIRDWRTSRRWVIGLEKKISMAIVTYGKQREVIRTDDLILAADAVICDARKLSEKHDKRTIKSAAKKGDLGPHIINVLKERCADKDVRTHDDMKSISISTSDPSIYVNVKCEDTKVRIAISSSAGSVEQMLDMSDPSFDPEELAKTINEKMVQTAVMLNNATKQQEEIWDAAIISMGGFRC